MKTTRTKSKSICPVAPETPVSLPWLKWHLFREQLEHPGGQAHAVMIPFYWSPAQHCTSATSILVPVPSGDDRLYCARL